MPSGVAVVAIDFVTASDGAVRHGLTLARSGTRVYWVHVITQRELDATGQLQMAEKRAVALEQTTRRIFAHVEQVAVSLGEDSELDIRELDIAAEPRIASAHLTRTEEQVARAIGQAAIDYDAEVIVLGRRGRPGSVAEHLLNLCDVAPSDAPVVLLVPPAGQGLNKSSRWAAFADDVRPKTS